jgi:hypothetical protein
MLFKKKVKVKEELATPVMTAQSKRLSALKQALIENNNELKKQTEETKQVIAEVSAKLKSGIRKLDPKLGLFTTMKGEGVAFVDFRGEIIHVNNAAALLLNRPVSDLLKKRIDYILTGSKRKRISIEECSKLIIEKVKEDVNCTYNALCETARTAYLLKTSNVAMHLDEPVCIVLKSGDKIHPLRVTISLLDTAPKELEDVTFLCKISQIAGSPAPCYYQHEAETVPSRR